MMTDFLSTLVLVFMLFCWICCLVYMMAREKDPKLLLIDLKYKWFYLVLFIVVTLFLVVPYYI